MAKVIVTEFVSLDGVMEGPGGEPEYAHTGWVFDFMSKEQEKWKFEEVMEADAHLLGRRTYEGFAAAWPQRGGEFADRMNSMKKYVASTTLSQDDLEWENSELLEGDVVEAVRKLREGDGGPLLVAGSRTLVQTLIENDLVDELRLMIFPVILGSGKRLYPEGPDKKVMKLADSHGFPSGVTVLTYHPA